MSVGSISNSGFESMRAMFEAFRNGKTNIQKEDLEQIKSTLDSQNDGKASKTDTLNELIEKFSEIDANGDGMSSEELSQAVSDGKISAMEDKRAPHGPPPGDRPPGPPPGEVSSNEGSEQSSELLVMAFKGSQIGYDLFEMFKAKLGNTEEGSQTTENVDSATGEASVSLLDAMQQSEDTSGNASKSGDSESQADLLTRYLSKLLHNAYRQDQINQQISSSSLGSGIIV